MDEELLASGQWKHGKEISSFSVTFWSKNIKNLLDIFVLNENK